MISKIKALIPYEAKVRARVRLLQNKPTEALGFKVPTGDKRIFIFLAADYGNLGDVAITYAQHKFLSQTFPEYQVTEIPISATIEGVVFVKRVINKDDMITTVGGGNMGDMYPQIEFSRQLVMEFFPGHKMISFPQTIDFEDTPHGQKMLKKAISRYAKHNDLTLIAREEVSFATYKKHFGQHKILLLPDIVMTLDKTEPKYERKGVTVCLRDDKEKKMTAAQRQELLGLLKAEFGELTLGDTHIGGRDMSLRRLVFLNSNHKVQTSYQWIKKAKNIQLVTDFSCADTKRIIDQLKNTPPQDKEDLLGAYKDFKTAILFKG